MALPVTLDAAFMGAFSSQRTFEPQRQNNGLVFITGLGKKLKDGGFFNNISGNQSDVESVIALSIESFPAPKYSNNVIEVPYNNMRIKFAGAMVFEDMDVVLKDFVDVETAKILNQWRLLCGNPSNGAVGLAHQYKVNNVFTVLYAPDGSLPRFYQADGVWLSRLDCGDIDHPSDDYLRMTASLTCDRIIPLVAVDGNGGLTPNVGAGAGTVGAGGNITFTPPV